MPVQTMVGPPSPDWLIQTIDYAGIWVGLARSIWETKILSLERGHPEVAPYLDSITTCIQLPDIVFQSKQRQDTHLLYQVEAGVGRYQGKHLIVVVKKICPGSDRCARVCNNRLFEPRHILWGRHLMATDQDNRYMMAQYDQEQDILYLLFTPEAHEAIAEEVSDGVFVRFDPNTRQVIAVEFLDFSARVEDVFGSDRRYFGSEHPERVLPPLWQSISG